MGFSIIASLFLFLVAFVFSLPVLLPPLRYWARSGFDARGIVILLLAALTFLSTIAIVFILVAYINAEVMASKFWYAAPEQSEFVTEIWRRQITPTRFSQPCYTTATTCSLADERHPYLGFEIGLLRFAIIPAFIAAIINVFLVRWFTRPLKVYHAGAFL